MEIAGLGKTYFDNFGMASSQPVHSPENFAEILKKAYSENSSDEVSGANKNKIDKTSKLYQVCLEFETILVKNLLDSMRKTVQKSGLVDNGFAGKMYEDMLYDEYAKDFTKNANFGLAEQAYRQLERNFFQPPHEAY